MERKTKFILIGLIAVSVTFLFLFFATLNAKQKIQRERDDLIKENTTLSSKIAKIEKSLRDSENKISLLNKDLDRISEEKQEIEKKYEMANIAKEKLIERLKAQQAQIQPPTEPVALPATTEAYWGRVLKEKTDLEFQLASIRSELKSTQISNEELQRGKSVLELEINSLKHEKEDSSRQLEYNRKLIDSITQELVREKNDKIQIQDSFKLLKNENAILTRQLKSLNNRKINLEKKLAGLQEEKVTIERRLNEMETMLIDKVSQIGNLKEELDTIRGVAGGQMPQEKKESVELPPIVVRPQPEPEIQEIPLEPKGKILGVNEDNNFVIIDLGQEQGIKVGDTFSVYREGKSIASIEVIQTRKNIAACDIKRETAPIKVGDTVR